MAEQGQTVTIIDDDVAVRESLTWLLESVGIGTRAYETAAAFLEDPRSDGSSCLIVDVRLPGMSGLELQDVLRERGWGVPVIIITGHGDVPMAIRAMKAGAFDFVEKPFADQILLDRVRSAIERNDHRLTIANRRQALAERRQTLTDREREVMDMVVLGKLNKQIAASLGLSHKTIEVHRARVMDKMQAASLADLVRMAIELE